MAAEQAKRTGEPPAATRDMAGQPGHCCLCGRRDVRQLCRPCRRDWNLTLEARLPDWLRELQRLAQAATKRARYWEGKVAVESLDRLTDGE